MSDLEFGVSGASASFANANDASGADSGGVAADGLVGTGSQVNEVAAVQPPNGDVPSPLSALVNGPSPLAAFPAYPETPLSGVWSFGPIPINGSGTATAAAYGPLPGSGGGNSLTSGTPTAVGVGPFSVSAAAGGPITLKPGNSGQLVKIGKQSLSTMAPLDLFFYQAAEISGAWTLPCRAGSIRPPRRCPRPTPTRSARSRSPSSLASPIITTSPTAASVTWARPPRLPLAPVRRRPRCSGRSRPTAEAPTPTSAGLPPPH